MYRPNGKQIRVLRERLGVTAWVVGAATKVDYRTIEDWEAGKTRTDFFFNRLARVASYLGVPYTDLIELVPEPVAEEQA
jgi:transcriptional regulator with XRE-family HTH domain